MTTKAISQWLTDPGYAAFERWSSARGWKHIDSGYPRGWYCSTCDDYFGLSDEMPIWHCGVCGGHQGITRESCHNCHEGERPAMNDEQRARETELWEEWRHQSA